MVYIGQKCKDEAGMVSVEYVARVLYDHKSSVKLIQWTDVPKKAIGFCYENSIDILNFANYMAKNRGENVVYYMIHHFL